MSKDREWDRFVSHVREELVPKIFSSSIYLSITPESPEKVDVKFAVELGLAVMLDKPIIAMVRPGAVVSDNLRRVARRIVEVDVGTEAGRTLSSQTLKELLPELSPGHRQGG